MSTVLYATYDLSCFIILTIRRPSSSTLTDTLLPYRRSSDLDMLVGSAARANALASGREEEGAQQLAAAPTRIERPVAPAKARTLSLSSLPRDGAIIWGNPSGQTVTVFSDFRCGYCRALTGVLKDMNVRVVDRPI